MISMSRRMMRALERSPIVKTVIFDIKGHSDLIAGESEIVIDGQLYGVLRYERQESTEGWSTRVEAKLIPLDTEVIDGRETR